MLKFSQGNAKLGKDVYTFSLLSGHACPFADKCLSKAIEQPNGKRKIQDGKNTEFRCFSASQEVMFNATYAARKHNFDALRKLRSAKAMADLINTSLPAKACKIRIHVAGDFFNQTYFDAWIRVAEVNPDRLFYAYTKSLKFWVARLDRIPANLRLTASKGGKLDHMIKDHGLRSARVVFSESEAQDLGLSIDHDDGHAMGNGGSFALLLHGPQPKGSKASGALVALKSKGKGGYSRKAKKKSA